MHGMKMPLEAVLAENLRRLRKKGRLTQENLAMHAGLTVRAYRDIEEERYIPPIGILIRLARALGCRLDDLLPLDEIE